jgi:hypothetical protein
MLDQIERILINKNLLQDERDKDISKQDEWAEKA